MTNQTPFPCQALADEVAHLKAYRDSLPPKAMVVVGQNDKTGETIEEERDNPEIRDTNGRIREAEGRLQQCVDSFTKRADVRLEDTRAIVLSPGGLEIQAPSVTAKLPNGQQVDLLKSGGDTSQGLAELRSKISDLQAQLNSLKTYVDDPGRVVTRKKVVAEQLVATKTLDTPWLEVNDVNAKGAVTVAETLTAKKVAVSETVAAKRLRAESSGSPALEIVGDMAFSRCGWVVIPPGGQTAEVPASLNARTMVLAVVRGAGPEWVQGAWGQQAATSSIQIRLNQPASQSVVVGWFLIEAAEAHPFYRPPEPPSGAAAEVM